MMIGIEMILGFVTCCNIYTILGSEISNLASGLGYDREVVRIWFCNKRQASKNTAV
jgi:hypothetical protein